MRNGRSWHKQTIRGCNCEGLGRVEGATEWESTIVPVSIKLFTFPLGAYMSPLLLLLNSITPRNSIIGVKIDSQNWVNKIELKVTKMYNVKILTIRINWIVVDYGDK